MTRDKQRKQAARRRADARGIRYTRARREINQDANAPAGEGTRRDTGYTTVKQMADEVAHRAMRLSHIPAEPLAHRADHLGQCLSRAMYSTAVDLAYHCAVHVGAFAGSGVVDEMTLHYAGQVVGHLTRAEAATRDALALMAAEAREQAVELLAATESVMVRSCQLARQIRMSRNEWYCDITGESQTCSTGMRDLHWQVRHEHSGRTVQMPPGCVGHIAEEIVSWTDIPGIEVDVLGPDRAAIDLAHRRAAGLRDTEHWLLGLRWWEKARTLRPESPFTALFQ